VTGLEAIAHHNGWMMALFGAAIVFSGLAVLSFVISQLPKLFGLFEAGPTESPPDRTEASTKTAVKAAEPAPAGFSTDPSAIAAQIEPLISMLNEPFQLSDLYRLCREHDLPHPHLSLSCLRQKGILRPEGEGAFTWKSADTTAQEG
jgi:hypothetical protein